jgi:HNH endonuclease.
MGITLQFSGIVQEGSTSLNRRPSGMPKGRPAISAEVTRSIMIEAGHRCAVDGTRFPLEKAHIVAWNESKDHTAENLILLCANCHEMFDLGKIDAATMREYKKKPWVSRYNNGQPGAVEIKETKKAQITIDVKLADFTEQQGRLLQHALASFLDISPSNIKIGPPEESNSIKVTVELPSDEMDKLSDAFERKDPDLFAYLAPFGLIDLRVIPSDEAQRRDRIRRLLNQSKKSRGRRGEGA